MANNHPFQPVDGVIRRRKRGYLPHWESAGAAYFVTFRTTDSLPAAVVSGLRARRELLAKQQAKRELLPVEGVAVNALSNRHVEQILDKAHGDCPMMNSDVARAIGDALRFWDNDRYVLFAWAVMPNHVHVVFSPQEPHTLSSVVASWKSFTANTVNRLLNRTGAFWQREYFDRLLRDEPEFERAVSYVMDNPASAGLVEWPWVWKRSDT